jgi:hypothetical protein
VSDVALDHFTQNLTEGILRAHFQTSTTEATPAVTGKTYEYKIDLTRFAPTPQRQFPSPRRNVDTAKSVITVSAFV